MVNNENDFVTIENQQFITNLQIIAVFLQVYCYARIILLPSVLTTVRMTKFLTAVYAFLRMLSGSVLMVHGYLNTVFFDKYLMKVENYFAHTTHFNWVVLKATSSFVPFEEFTLGLFLLLGFYTRTALLLSLVLFAFLSLFLFDGQAWENALFHFGMACLFALLLLCQKSCDKPLWSIKNLISKWL